jgi:tetratricopeptide (TPR) repeat protein
MFKYFDKEIVELVDRYEKSWQTEKKEFFDSEEYLDIIRFYQSISDEGALREVLEDAVKQHSNSSEILLRQAGFYILAQLENKAMEILRQVEILEPSEWEIYFLKSIIYNRRKQFDESDKMLDLAKENGAEELDLLFGRVEQLLEKEEYDKAYSLISERIDDLIEADHYFEQVIRFAYATGHAEDLEKTLEIKSAESPFDVEIKKRLIEFFIEAGKMSDAADVNAFILAINPNDEEAIWFAEQVTAMSTDMLQAVSDNNAGKEISEQEYDVLFNTAEHYEKEGHLEIARDYFLKLLEIPLSREITFFRLGRIACMNELYSNARLYLDKALFTLQENNKKNDELEAEIYHWLSRMYEGIDDDVKMLEYDLLAIEKDPQNKDFLYVYILDLCDKNQFFIAEEYLDRVVENFGLSGQVLLMFGAVKFFQKQYDEAEKYFHQAFQIDGNTAEDAEYFLEDIKSQYPLEKTLGEFYRLQFN